jgi:hypothetical protein
VQPAQFVDALHKLQQPTAIAVSVRTIAPNMIPAVAAPSFLKKRFRLVASPTSSTIRSVDIITTSFYWALRLLLRRETLNRFSFPR